MPDLSLFEQLLDEAAGPYVAILGGGEIVVEVPDADAICDLDTTAVSHAEVLNVLAGEQSAGELFDLLASRPVSHLVDLVADLRVHFACLRPPSGGFSAVVEQIDLYGEAIEYDLAAVLGLDLLDWFRDHERYPWAKLLRLLAQLPPGSHYHTAVNLDVEVARQREALRARGELPAAQRRPSLTGWDATRETATATLETLRRIEHAVWAASPKFKGKGGRPPQPLPRPLTAADRLEQRGFLEQHDSIMGQLLGDRYIPRFGGGEREPSPEVIRGGVLLG